MESRISQLQSEVKKREQERDEVIEDLLVAQEECSMNADSIIRHSAASDNDDEDEGPVHQSEDILANLEAFDINFDTVFKEEKVAIESAYAARKEADLNKAEEAQWRWEKNLEEAARKELRAREGARRREEREQIENQKAEEAAKRHAEREMITRERQSVAALKRATQKKDGEIRATEKREKALNVWRKKLLATKRKEAKARDKKTCINLLRATCCCGA
ncbi:hypothetical protein CYMTET_5401 [Cymbomonas tetramitiformis]|uniref:Uncharacterized protein n=1 Tax=Cymbomonas tetramitiformis TaxID=36881 RepID=A0AAE0LJ41_9CHLO|nr:hypothetical protein CYMTET_5401 [Cymbomonas tetramitiformis]